MIKHSLISLCLSAFELEIGKSLWQQTIPNSAMGTWRESLNHFHPPSLFIWRLSTLPHFELLRTQGPSCDAVSLRRQVLRLLSSVRFPWQTDSWSAWTTVLLDLKTSIQLDQASCYGNNQLVNWEVHFVWTLGWQLSKTQTLNIWPKYECLLIQATWYLVSSWLWTLYWRNCPSKFE